MLKKIPFAINPNKYPFFYGYLITLVGTIGVLSSLPGQTVGVSTFTDPVKDALGLTRDQFSIAYMIGTILSSFLLTKAGRLYDTYGAKITAALASSLLGCTLILGSFSDNISNFIKSIINIHHWSIPFIVITILFFLMRFSGQGVLTMVSRNMVMKWFDKHRGRINAISSVSVSLAFSASPILINETIELWGWKGAWQIMAISLIFTLVMILFFFKDNPEKYGLLPDGAKEKAKNHKTDDIINDASFTLKQATKTRAFWIYTLTLSFNSFLITGLTFHITSIFNSAGYTKTEALSIFLPISIISVSTAIIGNYISDIIRLKTLLFIMLTASLTATLGIVGLNYGWGIYLLIAGLGIMGGLFATLMPIVWPRFFGRKHLGEISGKAMSMLVFASAIGPVVFSTSNTYLYNYTGVAWFSIVFLIPVIIGAFKANNPAKQE